MQNVLSCTTAGSLGARACTRPDFDLQDPRGRRQELTPQGVLHFPPSVTACGTLAPKTQAQNKEIKGNH